MPPSDDDEGLQVADMLRRTQPETGVVVLSQFSEPQYGLALLDQGSDGRAYLLKEHVHERLAHEIAVIGQDDTDRRCGGGVHAPDFRARRGRRASPAAGGRHGEGRERRDSNPRPPA